MMRLPQKNLDPKDDEGFRKVLGESTGSSDPGQRLRFLAHGIENAVLEDCALVARQKRSRSGPMRSTGRQRPVFKQ
jgi:hypothetical protein